MFSFNGLFGALLVAAASGAAERASGPSEAAIVDSYNYVLGTQTFAPKYGFTDETRLVETARAIRQMGANLIKFDLGPRATASYRLPKDPPIRSLRQMAEREPSCRAVFDMPLAYYILWAYPHSVAGSAYHNWRDGFSASEREAEYREIYDLTEYLLKQYNGSGKTFLLGHWEGDWALLGSFDRRKDPSPEAVKGMIDWLNTRQSAVDDAKRRTKHEGVWVYHYTEVNLVRKAMQGGVTVANSVLPKTRVDYVSYSSYDSLTGRPSEFRGALQSALDYLQSKLPAKQGFSGKRVFLGEYGFPLTRVKTPREQERHARAAALAALQWGCPFVLYWQMYCNEVEGGEHRGFWLINDQGEKQPAYRMHERFLAAARRFVAEFQREQGRPPSPQEYRARAVEWLDQPP